MQSQGKAKVAVIGAGPTGITVLKNLLDQGIQAVGFDRGKVVGGNWVFSEENEHSSVFETTHIISSKTLSQYADYTWDDHDGSAADYPSHAELASYFQGYARHFQLEQHIRFQTEVLKIEKLSSNDWEIELEDSQGVRKEHFSHVVVCNGHHWDPRWPEYPGDFTGDFLHSHDFKKAEPFRDKRVLVIGGGNSACDVAVETSRVSRRTDISMRRGYRIIPKFFFGKPSDVIGQGSSWLPLAIRNKLNQALLRVVQGPNSAYGMQEPDHSFGATHPTVNDELLYRIRHGKVHPKVDIARLEGDTVHFKDGSSADYDVIIACTGFLISHPFFEKSFIDYSQGSVPLYLKMIHPRHDDLFFPGLFQPLGCIWPLAELQAKIIARQIAGKWQRPNDVEERIRKDQQNPHYKQIGTPRHTITVDYHLFRKELLRELPASFVSKTPVARSENVMA